MISVSFPDTISPAHVVVCVPLIPRTCCAEAMPMLVSDPAAAVLWLVTIPLPFHDPPFRPETMLPARPV
jgi:hypothetical protein